MAEPPAPEGRSPGPQAATDLRARIIELVEQAIIVTDLEGIVTFMNPAAGRLYGWEANEAVGRNVVEVTVPDVSRDQACQIMDELRAGRSWSGEFIVQRRDGTPFVAAVTDTPVFDEERRLFAIIGVSTDVTERKRAEDALRASQARFRALADESPVGVFETDAERRFLYLNRRARTILGVAQDAATGGEWPESLHPEDRERVVREWNVAIAAGRVFSSEFRLRGPSRRSTLVQGHTREVRDRDGRIAGHIGAIVDVTETRALQTQLVLASRLAEIGNLVTGAAREIDHPPAGALSDPEAALEVARGARRRLQGVEPVDRTAELRVLGQLIEAIEHAQERGRRIARIVQGLSMLAGAVPGRIRVRMYDIVNQAMHWLPDAVARGASIHVEGDGAQDVRASAGQIEQVVVNLVSNAVKATPAGKRCSVVVRIARGSLGMTRLEVIDRGAGIDRAILGRIFEPFFTTRDVGEGVGLGLAVSHAIVTSHGGTLTVESAVGRGSTFRVELPVAEA